ncbi:DUF4136 domain-containing protein [Flavobacteriaceae bacterium]|nr:DUF4136 domain-containing protein [Flavobacteriaceae bacterium]
MKYLKLIAVLLVGAFVVASCYKNPDLDKLQYDFVVATDYDEEADFSSYMTYYISDTIATITDNPRDSILVGEGATQIVNRIKSHMDSRGYQFVGIDQNPDLAMITSVIQTKNLGSVCSGWWWGYPGYYPPWWWGYPSYGYYYPFCSYYTYDIGTLNVELFDLKNVDSNQNIRVLWNDINFGVLSSYDQTNISRSLDAIDQAFEQSPYLEN